MKSPNKHDYLDKNDHQIVIYDNPNCLNNVHQLINYKNLNDSNIPSAHLPLKSSFYNYLKTYDPTMYYDFDTCFGDKINLNTNVRQSITLNIRVEYSNKIESNNLVTSKFIFMRVKEMMMFSNRR